MTKEGKDVCPICGGAKEDAANRSYRHAVNATVDARDDRPNQRQFLDGTRKVATVGGDRTLSTPPT
jgi:hypothetical protein